jgi:ArsR family transcriptional regulator
VTTDPASIEEISEILRTIAHPARIRILLQLTRADACVTELSGALQLPAPHVSHQLRHLRHARLVRRYRVQGRMHYALTGVPAISFVLNVLAYCTSVLGDDRARSGQPTGAVPARASRPGEKPRHVGVVPPDPPRPC